MEHKNKTRAEILTELARLPQASKVSSGIRLLNQKKAPNQDEVKFPWSSMTILASINSP
jgi:hypothetical protein